MVSFSSSAINKSGKKFAPKAPVRRAGAAPTAPGPARTSVDRQTISQTSHATTDTAVPASTPPPPTVTEATTTTTLSSIPVTLDTHAPEPSPPRTKPTSPPTATAIPIPAPKRKASISAPVPIPFNKPPTPHPTPQTPPTPAVEPVVAPEPESNESTVLVEQRPNGDTLEQQVAPDDTRRTETPPAQEDSSTQIRPAKRLKTSQTAIRAPTTWAAPTPTPQALPVPAPAPTTAPTTASVPLVTPPNTQPDVVETGGPSQTDPGTVSPTASNAGPKTAKPRKKKAAENAAAEVVAQATRERRPRQRRKREPTPEGSESIEIAPAVVRMSDLCKDLRTGRKSKREIELQNMELAEMERKQREREEKDNAEPTPIKQNGDHASPSIEPDKLPKKKPQAGPVMRIVNGEIVLDTASLQVDRHADAARDAGELEDVVENPLTRKINQATYGKRTKTESWDEEMTDLFYRGLRMFGTDFMMISKMFPGRSRRQIKLKFNNEERRDPERIKETLLGPAESIDIATYSEMTNTVYDDPRVIQQELDEEKKRIEDQHAKEKEAQEELLRNPTGAGDNATQEKDNGQKSRSRNKKSAAVKSMGGGTEEVLGSIDDFSVHA